MKATERFARAAKRVRWWGLRIKGWIQDWPWLVNGIGAIVLAAYWSATWKWPTVSGARALDKATTSDNIMFLNLGVATLAAMVAGFSGVVVIFGLSGDSERFRRLRESGGDRLEANWTSVIAVAFGGAFLAVVCAGLAIGGLVQVSLWLGFYALLLAGHGSLRLVWLLQKLARIVRGDDQDHAVTERQVDAASLIPVRRAAG